MKPLNDKELGEVISRKIASVDNVKTDHLWSEIESGLPSSSSGYMTGVIKSLLFVATFTSVLTISESSGFAMKSRTNEVEFVSDTHVGVSDKTEPLNELGMSPVSSYATENHGQNEIEVRKHIEKVPETRNHKEGSRSRHLNEVANVEFIHSMPVNYSMNTPYRMSELEEIRSKKQWIPSVSISPYLSFHKMDPHAFDENYITSSNAEKISLFRRSGVNISYGYTKPLTKRWSLSAALGFDYYRTQFNYRIANYIDSEVQLENHRLDGGLALGLGYRINSPVGEGMLQADLWMRHKLYGFGKKSSYNNAILGYRLSYLVDIGNIQVGPTFGSFLNSSENDMGRIRPMQYGFIIRKQIFKN